MNSNMIKEDYVSFEIAKLLKEKKFNTPLLTFYITDKEKKEGDFQTMYFADDAIDNNHSELCFIAPTQAVAMKWLREVHKIHIQIWILEEKGYWFDIEKILNAQYKHKSLYSTGLEDIYYDTYEQACEAAIKYCLENLI